MKMENRRYVMITMPNCPNCDKSKKKLNDTGLSGIVEVLTIADAETKAIASKYGIRKAGIQIIDLKSETVMTVDEFVNSFNEGV